jgi:hypothetical protein
MRAMHYLMAGVSGLVLVLASCSSKSSAPESSTKPSGNAGAPGKPAKELIVGKWQRTDPGKTDWIFVIEKDGAVQFGAPGAKSEAKSTFDEKENTLAAEVKPILGSAFVLTWKVDVKPDTLTLKVVDSKTKNEDGTLSVTAEDKERKNQEEEHYKRGQ